MVNDSGVHCVVFTEDTFGEKIWETVSNQIQVLVKQGYQVRVYDDDIGIYVIQYSYNTPDLQTHELLWVPMEHLDGVEELLDEYELEDEYDCCGCADCCNDCEEYACDFNSTEPQTQSNGVEVMTYPDGSEQISFDI